MNRLLEIGFAPAGHWLLRGENVIYELANFGTQRNILYAFVCDGEVKYVGKTVQTLRSRMNGYQTPGNGQTTNIRNNALIKASLRQGTTVEILALPDSGLMHYGQFHLNLAAGLEDSIINVLKPEWNGQHMTPKETAELSQGEQDETEPAKLKHFALTLQPTYFQQGFFNVGTGQSSLFGSDGEKIEIFCGENDPSALTVTCTVRGPEGCIFEPA